MTRDEHLACKRRALEYVDADDLSHAIAGMASDLRTHPDTDNPARNGLATIGMMYMTDGDNAAVQRWIERFRRQSSTSCTPRPAIHVNAGEPLHARHDRIAITAAAFN